MIKTDVSPLRSPVMPILRRCGNNLQKSDVLLQVAPKITEYGVGSLCVNTILQGT